MTVTPRPRFLGLFAFVLWAVLLVPSAGAGVPTDQVKTRIDRVIQLLSDPEMSKPERTADRRAAMRRIAGELFDFNEISRRSLARHWQGRTPAEREEFVRLFGDLLERAYISKIELYSGEKIEYVGEVADGDTTTVKTRLLTKQGTPIPIDYRLMQQNGQWRAYDALIEGVSLVGNYRTQFNSVIQRTSYDDLVKTLRTKSQEGAAAPPAASRPGSGSGGMPPASGRTQTP